MSGILMAGCYDFFLIKWIANILGVIMSGLYAFFDCFGIHNIGICIVLFTIIIKMLLFPVTLKQQKFSKVSAKMNPELNAIRVKYANKRDNDSMVKQQAETMAVYEKYGTSPTGSCLPMFLQMLILLALYAVIVRIPNYVEPISDVYKDMSSEIVVAIENYSNLNSINNIVDTKNEDFDNIATNTYDRTVSFDENKDNIYSNLIDTYANVKPLENFNNGYDDALNLIKKFSDLSEDDWKKAIEKSEDEKDIKLLEKYQKYSDDEWNKMASSLKSNKNKVEKCEDEISNIYTFLWIDLSKTPSASVGNGAWYALIIPLLSFLTQWFSTKLSTANQPDLGDNPMASSMKVMTFTMPLVSAFFCYSLPAGLGVYWVMAAVVQIVQQIAINQHFKKVSVDEMIQQNIEAMKKKKARKGINVDENRISNAAAYNAKSIKVDPNKFASLDDNASENVSTSNSGKKGSIASRANMVKEFNEKNSK